MWGMMALSLMATGGSVSLAARCLSRQRTWLQAARARVQQRISAVEDHLALLATEPKTEAIRRLQRWLGMGAGAALIVVWTLHPATLEGVWGPLNAVGVGVFGAAAGAAGGSWSLGQRHAQAKRRALYALPSWIDAVQLTLSGGATARSAVEHASLIMQRSRPDAPLSLLLAGVLRRLALGASLNHAITPFETRLSHTHHGRELCALVRLAADDGGRVGPMLDELAQRIRQEHAQQIEEHASHAMAKMLLPLILLMASALLLIVGPFAIHIIEDGL